MLPSPDINRFNQKPTLRELSAVYFENFLVTSVNIIAREKKDCLGSFIYGIFKENIEAKIVLKTWQEIPGLFSYCSLGNYGVSTNEFTGILKIDTSVQEDITLKYIPSIISRFKSRSTKLLNQLHGTHDRIFWKSGFIEKPINNLQDLSEILNKISSHK
jgi:hypothetical protein